MIKNLGVQLYTVRDYLADPEFADLTFKKLRELGYTEVQTAGTAFDEFEFGKLLEKHGLSVVGTHCSLDEIVGQQEKMLELHRAWGTTNIGIGGMPTARRKDLATLKEFIAEFNRAAEFYGKHGLKLTYHHHNFEFLRMDGKKTIMDLFCEEFDPDNISFVLDTCWISAGGGEVVEWMERLAGRLDILHLKDTYLEEVEPKKYSHKICEVGEGSVAWDKVIATAEKIGVKYYVVEQDNGFTKTPFESLSMSADFLEKYRA